MMDAAMAVAASDSGRLRRTMPALACTAARLSRYFSEAVSIFLQLEAIADRCGFAGARQLRRVWKAAFGTAPASSRRKSKYATDSH